MTQNSDVPVNSANNQNNKKSLIIPVTEMKLSRGIQIADTQRYSATVLKQDFQILAYDHYEQFYTYRITVEIVQITREILEKFSIFEKTKTVTFNHKLNKGKELDWPNVRFENFSSVSQCLQIGKHFFVLNKGAESREIIYNGNIYFKTIYNIVEKSRVVKCHKQGEETVVDDGKDLPAERRNATPGTGYDRKLIYRCLVKATRDPASRLRWSIDYITTNNNNGNNYI
ncbi:hypothetical protein WN51_06184 [Melipona quadrifasciata]|uniref:Uncharacterized protein n=1 Tax=Melipona quadrifasciata TaxID=166423 RepID=A0A0M8ZSL1_9HYME|nr:hypothetical protein WN51_06184 [Melipona quadrifasciata]